MGERCQFCGVLPAFGHQDWCKIERAPTVLEVAQAVINEYERSIDEGPSSQLADMAKAAITHG